jgi:hypothetical protein
MNVRYLGALALLSVGVGWLPAQAPPPLIGSAIPPAGASAPALPPEALFSSTGGNLVYGGADYLLWKIRGATLPQNVNAIPVGLVTVTSTDTFINGVPATVNNTQVLPLAIVNTAGFGGSRNTDFGSLNGGRVTLGLWADQGHGFGVEAQGFVLERGNDSRIISSVSQPGQILLDTGAANRTYVVVGGQPPTLVTSTPITVLRNATGRVAASASSSLYGLDLNARSTNLKIGSFDFTTLGGVRYIGFKDEVGTISTVNLTQADGGANPADTLSRDVSFSSVDRIRIWNNFLGAQAGFDVESYIGNLYLFGRLKAAVGPNVQRAQVSGVTNVINNDAGRPTPESRLSPGGLLVGAGDTGSSTTTRFSFIPEVNLKVGYRFTDSFRVTVGYDGIYMGNMSRAGLSSFNNNLTTTVTAGNNTNTNTVSQPGFRYVTQDVWVQGLNMGFELLF